MKRLLSVMIFIIATSAMYSQEINDSISTSNDSLMWEKLLDGVTVTAQRQLIKTEIDRIGYDIQADEESKSENVLNMLRKVPMVSVDAQENIKVKGSSNYKIYKNGRPDPSLTKNAKEILRSMPASLVKRIEVITDPGAREDAEGVDAILNIVMMDNKGLEGITGSLTGTYTSLNHPQANAYFTTQLGKFIISADYGYGGISRKETENNLFQDRSFLDTGNLMHTEGRSSNPGSIHFADINASYEIDSLNLLSGSFGGYFYNLDVNGSNHTSMYDSSNSLLSDWQWQYDMPDYSHQSWNGNMNYEHKTQREGESLTLSYMLSLTRQHTVQEDNFTNVLGSPFTYNQLTYNTRENFTEHTFQFDWVRPLFEGHKLWTGMKYINRLNTSHSIEDIDGVSNPENDRRLDHTTRVGAAYIDYQFDLGRWSGRAGLRYEHSYMKAHYPDGKSSDFSKHLNDWVPQASLKYQFTDAQSIKLSYSTSIHRPGIEYLNPSTVTSPTLVSRGNPELVSSRQQRLTLMYMYVGRNLTLQLAPSYTFFNDNIGIIESASDNVLYRGYDNILRLRRWQLEGYVQWKPLSGTTIVMNWNMSHTNSSNPDLGIAQKGLSTFYYGTLTQKLPWKLTGTASIYGSIGHSPNNVYSYGRSWYSYSFSLQRSFLTDDRLTVRIGARNPFDKYLSNKDVTNQGDYFETQINRNVSRSFYISLSWRFGKLKASVKKTEMTIENDDVVGGIRKGNN